MPVVQTVNILILLHPPLLGNIRHADLLALVHKRRAGHQSQDSGQHLRRLHAVLLASIDIPVNTARLVMILPVQGVPAIILIHKRLPALEERLQVSEFPAPRLELVVAAVVDIDVLEVEDHVDLVAVVAHSLQDLVRVRHERHLAHAERVVFLQDLAHGLEVLV